MDWCLFCYEDASTKFIQLLTMTLWLLKPGESLWPYIILASKAISWENVLFTVSWYQAINLSLAFLYVYWASPSTPLFFQETHETMYLDTVTDINEILNTVPDDNSDADVDLGYEKHFSLVIMVMRTCIYLLLPLYLRNLLFPWLLMKMLLTIFLKIPHHVVEIMFVLMMLLLAFKVVQSGVHHTSVHPPPLPPHFLLGGWTSYQIFKNGGAWPDLICFSLS